MAAHRPSVSTLLVPVLIAALLPTVAVARPRDPASPEARMSGVLAQGWTLARAADHVSDASGFAAFRARHPTLADPDRVRVVVISEGEPDFADLNATVEATAGDSVQLVLPWTALGELALRPGVRHVREPWYAQSKGETVTEGYGQVMGSDWHNDSVTGAGVRVGIVDVGFVGWEDLEGSELPGSVTTLLDDGAPESTAHGAAVAEVVHDFAPDADLTLISFGTDVEFGQALQSMLDSDQHIVNASIGFDNVWHPDGTSSVTRYADATVAAGVTYVAAAGNEGERYRVGELTAEEGTQYFNIAGHYAILLERTGGVAHVSFRWSEPFGEAKQDFDLVLINADDLSECARSDSPQDGDDNPFEEVWASGCSNEIYAAVYSDSDADPEGIDGYLYSAWGFADGEATDTESLTLPGDCFDCITVGAYDYANQQLPPYSSRGPTYDGRIKPDLVAPTNVTTVSVDTFEGSSAAAPHVTGLVALWQHRTDTHNDPAADAAWLLSNAVDLGPPGTDNNYGAGKATSGSLPPAACGCATAVPSSAAGLLLLGPLLALRRRCA